MAAPSGPPEPIKPAFELYGEMLLDAGRDKEAVQAFEQSLLRTPKRTPSVKGLARVAAKARTSSAQLAGSEPLGVDDLGRGATIEREEAGIAETGIELVVHPVVRVDDEEIVARLRIQRKRDCQPSRRLTESYWMLFTR